MANAFSKEERVAFEQILEGFQDAEVMAKNVMKYETDQTTMERTGDTIWRPQPYIMNSFDGQDQTSNFNDKTQLSVPATISIEKSVPWVMSATDLRDALQEGRLGEAAKQKLASDINRAILDVASLQGSMVVQVKAAASGFDDVAEIEAVMNEAGVRDDDRILALSTRDYNGMAGNLANRVDLSSKKSLTAYEKAYVGQIASFDTWKLDYSKRIGVAAGGAITVDTTSGTGNGFTPAAVTANPTTSERLNQDNRYQTLTFADGTGDISNVVAGDCFTIADVNAVHHITKEDTGQLKTFRVISATDTTITFTPPIIDPAIGTGSEAEIQYQNCVVNTESATSAVTWLNTAATAMNPFWQKEALEILPGRYAVPENAGAAVLRGRTESGIEVCMSKQYDIKTMKTYFRLDTRFGVVNKAPEMSGVILFNQV